MNDLYPCLQSPSAGGLLRGERKENGARLFSEKHDMTPEKNPQAKPIQHGRGQDTVDEC